MKKYYTTPKVHFIAIDHTDIIATSGTVGIYNNSWDDMDEDDVQ